MKAFSCLLPAASLPPTSFCSLSILGLQNMILTSPLTLQTLQKRGFLTQHSCLFLLLLIPAFYIWSLSDLISFQGSSSNHTPFFSLLVRPIIRPSEAEAQTPSVQTTHLCLTQPLHSQPSNTLGHHQDCALTDLYIVLVEAGLHPTWLRSVCINTAPPTVRFLGSENRSDMTSTHATKLSSSSSWGRLS